LLLQSLILTLARRKRGTNSSWILVKLNGYNGQPILIFLQWRITRNQEKYLLEIVSSFRTYNSIFFQLYVHMYGVSTTSASS
jgi:hypothetical protein